MATVVKPAASEMARVAEVMSSVAAQAVRLPDRDVSAVLREVELALAEAKSKLREVAKSLPAGEYTYTAQHHRVAVAQLEQIKEILTERLPRRMTAILANGSSRIGAASLDLLADEIAQFGTIFQSSVAPIAFNKAAIVARGNHMLVRQYASSCAQYGAGLGSWADTFRRELTRGLLRRDSIHTLTNKLMDLAGPNLRIAKSRALGEGLHVLERIPEGMWARHRYTAERLVRTELMGAYNQHHLEGLRELDSDPDEAGWLKRWDATADRRLCQQCHALDGEAVGVDDNFSAGVQAPPVHPNDRCVLTPWREEWSLRASRTVQRETRAQHG